MPPRDYSTSPILNYSSKPISGCVLRIATYTSCDRATVLQPGLDLAIYETIAEAGFHVCLRQNVGDFQGERYLDVYCALPFRIVSRDGDTLVISEYFTASFTERFYLSSPTVVSDLLAYIQRRTNRNIDD